MKRAEGWPKGWYVEGITDEAAREAELKEMLPAPRRLTRVYSMKSAAQQAAEIVRGTLTRKESVNVCTAYSRAKLDIDS